MLVLTVFVAVLFAPLFVLLEFKVHQDRIARELCVQRDVVDTMRTCHGHCQLSKRFKQLEREAGSDFPAERIQNRWEPVAPISGLVPLVEPSSQPRSFPRYCAMPISQPAERVDHVPWA